MVTKSDQFAQQSAAFGRANDARSDRRRQFDKVVGVEPAPLSSPEIAVELISQNPDNPRDHLRDLDELTQSVREVGVVNAISVGTVDAYLRERPDQADRLDPGTTYVVVDGHRRLEASRRAQKATIKVTIDDVYVSTDESLLEAAFIANYHRDGMTELEEAVALEKLVKFYGGQSKASKRLGMAQSTVSTKLSYLKLSGELQADLAEGRRPAEQVRNLGKLSPDEQRARADERAREAQTRPKTAAPAAPAQPAPVVPKDPGPDYHAVINEEAVPAEAALPEPRQGRSVESPPQDSQPAAPVEGPKGAAWPLPSDWKTLIKEVVAQYPEFDRHMATRGLVKVMEEELGAASEGGSPESTSA